MAKYILFIIGSLKYTNYYAGKKHFSKTMTDIRNRKTYEEVYVDWDLFY